jgi:hypothetical protein
MSDVYPILVLTPVAGLAVYCASHILLAWLVRSPRPYTSLSGGFLCGLAVVVGVTLALLVLGQTGLRDSLGLLTLNLLTYLALAFGYFNFINLNIASLRIRMLQEMWLSDEGMTREQLLAHYSTDDVIALRIARLTRGGHLVEREGRFYRGRLRFLLVARIFDLLRVSILGTERSVASGPDVVRPGQTEGKS